jgi:hypothetical protein
MEPSIEKGKEKGWTMQGERLVCGVERMNRQSM